MTTPTLDELRAWLIRLDAGYILESSDRLKDILTALIALVDENYALKAENERLRADNAEFARELARKISSAVRLRAEEGKEEKP